MSFAAHLIHSCSIQRYTEALDAYNNAEPQWSTVATKVPCRLVEKQQRLLVTERVESAVVTSHTLLVDEGTELLERDRITNIRLEDGALVNKTFAVKALLLRRARSLRHKSAVLTVVE